MICLCHMAISTLITVDFGHFHLHSIGYKNNVQSVTFPHYKHYKLPNYHCASRRLTIEHANVYAIRTLLWHVHKIIPSLKASRWLTWWFWHIWRKNQVRVIEIPIKEAPHELAQTHKTMVLWIPSINGTLALLAYKTKQAKRISCQHITTVIQGPNLKIWLPQITKHKCELQNPSTQLGTQHKDFEMEGIPIQHLGKQSNICNEWQWIGRTHSCAERMWWLQETDCTRSCQVRIPFFLNLPVREVYYWSLGPTYQMAEPYASRTVDIFHNNLCQRMKLEPDCQHHSMIHMDPFQISWKIL